MKTPEEKFNRALEGRLCPLCKQCPDCQLMVHDGKPTMHHPRCKSAGYPSLEKP